MSKTKTTSVQTEGFTRLPWIYKMAFKSERQHPEECRRDREALAKELLDWVEKVW